MASDHPGEKTGPDTEGVHNLLSMDDYKSALAKPGLMIIDAYAVWCGPCKVIAPKYVEFSKKYSDARFYKLDIDEVPDVAHELGIRVMPTFKLFKDGDELESVVGMNPPGLEKAIAEGLGVNVAGKVNAEAQKAEGVAPSVGGAAGESKV